MFSFFQKKPSKRSEQWQCERLILEGMHCTSCAVNIDLTLEDTAGIKSVSTHYAKSQTTVEFDPKETSIDQIVQSIERLGYRVKRSV